MKTTGLFFGSFNPIHVGHLIIANQIHSLCKLQEVWFVVTPHNPLKKKSSLLKDRDRLHLVRLAIDNNPAFRAIDIEFKLPQPSYTYDTLNVLKAKYPKRSFALIVGEDNLAQLPKWKNYEQIIENEILVYKRGGVAETDLHHHKNVRLLDLAHINIASTYIRQCISRHIDVRYILPEPVWQYIKSNHLYV